MLAEATFTVLVSNDRKGNWSILRVPIEFQISPERNPDLGELLARLQLKCGSDRTSVKPVF